MRIFISLLLLQLSGTILLAETSETNLALFATPRTSYVSPNEMLEAIQSGFDPANSSDHRHDAYGNWPLTGLQSVEYDWSQPISTGRVDVYWWQDGQGIHLPVSCRLLAWNGHEFLPVADAEGLGILPNRYNTTTFSKVTTTKLRLEFTSDGKYSTGILQWKVIDSGRSSAFPPRVRAGHDASVIVGKSLYLQGLVQPHVDRLNWDVVSGPRKVSFENASDATTKVTFSSAGSYTLKLTAGVGNLSASDTVQVQVVEPISPQHLSPVYTTRYQINSPLWSDRVKQLIVHWVPHCISKLSEPNLKEGGVQNLIEAGKKNAGKPFAPHMGPPWSDAYVFMTMEAMCGALEVDPQGDQEIVVAQQGIRAKLEEWIGIALAAQEKDGYLQSRFTLGNADEGGKPPARWSRRGDHEGYIAGAFIEAALADYQLSKRKDHRLYDAAVRLVDCWSARVGPPPRQAWFDGHENIEQALFRLGRYQNEFDGAGKGYKAFTLAKFLLDSRSGGGDYDQSRLPLVRQNEAVGHAVRAVYCYSAMADAAMELQDSEYQGAVDSIWNDLVDKKYYITGGVGSGETSEGFGRDYSLPNTAYCESCSGSGELIFQHKMNMAYSDATYADLMEDTLYNALLGSVDLAGENFTYTNPLVGDGQRYLWHDCPCCVGNIPRVLLNLPEWMYARAPDGLDVNLYIGSTVSVGTVAGTPLELIQQTDYPWKATVSIKVNPAVPTTFTLRLRIPDHAVSPLYTATPAVSGFVRLAVNGELISPKIEKGYVAIQRQWKTGDHIELELPMQVQRIKADKHVLADVGRVALRYGPLIYAVEGMKPGWVGSLSPDTPLVTEWRPDLLHGVVVIKAQLSGGVSVDAIPYYARQNRGDNHFEVWLKDGAATSSAIPSPTSGSEAVLQTTQSSRLSDRVP